MQLHELEAKKLVRREIRSEESPLITRQLVHVVNKINV